MKPIVYCVTIAIFVCQCVGRPTIGDNLIEQAADKYGQEVLSGNINVQEAVKKFVDEYKDKIQYHGEIFATGLKADSVNDTCKELHASLDLAQNYANEGALLTLHLTADMLDAVSNATDCLDINVFKALNCAAHKMQNGRNVFIKYKPQIISVGGNLNDSFRTVFSQLVDCFNRVRS